MVEGFGRIVKRRLVVRVLQGDVKMTALSRPFARPFRHERGHPTAPLGENFGKGLKQRSTIRRGQGIAILDGCSITPGPVSVCRPSSGKFHATAEFNEIAIELRMHAAPQH